MGIRVFISGNSGNKEIVTHQARILMILESLGIQEETVDISAPGMEEARDFMREHAKKKDGQRHVLPPQIFNGDKYCGDYDDFDVANEDDVLEEFLGIPRKTPAAGEGTGTNAEGEVGKLEGEPVVNGDSDKSEALKEQVQLEDDTESKTEDGSSSAPAEIQADHEAGKSDMSISSTSSVAAEPPQPDTQTHEAHDTLQDQLSDQA